MTDDQILAATAPCMKAMLDFYFPTNKEAPSVSAPEASVLNPNHPARDDKAERNEYYRRP